MGGLGSGRGRGGPTVEASKRIALYDLFREAREGAGTDLIAGVTWWHIHTGQVTARIEVILHLDNVRPSATILHLDDSGRQLDGYDVELSTTDQPLGGVRWWFVCPHTGWRVAALYLPNGASRFASAGAYGLDYRSQRISDRDRAIARARKIREKLGAGPNLSKPIEKPPRMRWETFNRELTKLNRAQGAACAYSLPAVEALYRRIERA